MARFDEPHHKRSGAKEVPARLRNAGKKLLGELADQIRLSPGVTTQKRRLVLEEGTVTAYFYNGMPVVEYAPADKRGADTAKTLMQGWVVRPRTQLLAGAYGTLSEALLDRFNQSDPADTHYVNLLYDSTYGAVDSPRAGYYKHNRSGELLFGKGLRYHGNVDWRNADETFVIGWGGATDRYFGLPGSTDFAGKKLCINGDIVGDFTDRVGMHVNEMVIGACLQGSKLVVATGMERVNDANPARIRLFTASLRAFGGETDDPPLGWLDRDGASVRLVERPRFGLVPVADWDEILNYTFVSSDAAGIRAGHPLCFNQSGTEGRMITRYRVGASESYNNHSVRELVVDISSLVLPTIESITLTDSLYVDTVRTLTNITGTLAFAFHTKNRDAISDTDAVARVTPTGNIASDYPLQLWTATYASAETPQSNWVTWAVDYRDDEPVYAYQRRHAETASGSWAANPFHEYTLPHTYGFNAVSSCTTDSAVSASITYAGFLMPWTKDEVDFSVVLTGSSSWSGRTDGAAESDCDNDVFGSVIPTLSLTTTATAASDELDKRLLIYYCDLRCNFLAYGVHTIQIVTAKNYVGSRGGSDVAPTIHFEVTGTETTTHSLYSAVVLGDTTIDESTTVLLDTFVDSSHPDIDFGTDADERWLAAAFYTPPLWPTGFTSSFSVISAAETDDTWVQAELDSFPPDGAWVVGTYDYTPVHDESDHPDLTRDGPNSVAAAQHADGPFTQNLFGSFAVIPWATTSLTPYAGATARNVVGCWQADRVGRYCYSMPWPEVGAGERWANKINDTRGLNDLTGQTAAPLYVPIWLTTKFIYDLKITYR